MKNIILFLVFLTFISCRDLSMYKNIFEEGGVLSQPMVCEGHTSAIYNFDTSVPGTTTVRWFVYNLDSINSTFDFVNKFLEDPDFSADTIYRVNQMGGAVWDVGNAYGIIDTIIPIGNDSAIFKASQEAEIFNGVINPQPLSNIQPNGFDARWTIIACDVWAVEDDTIRLSTVNPM